MTTIVVGLDGSDAGRRAVDYAKRLAGMIGDCRITLVFVIEWTAYSFHTREELEERHRRRETEIEQAHAHVLKPIADALTAEGFDVTAETRHGDAAREIETIAEACGAAQIIIGRTGEHGLRERLFGGVSGKLVGTAKVPVTIIP